MTESNLLQPPNSIEAEQSVLGAMMLSEKARDIALATLREGDFYRESHRMIFRAAADYASEGMELDAVTLIEWFRRKDLMGMIQNGAYLTSMANETPGPSNVSGYIKIIREKAELRRLIDIGMEISNGAMNDQGDAKTIAADATTKLMDERSFGGDEPRTINQVAASWIDQMQSMCDGEKVGLKTGLIDYDNRIRHFLPGELIIIAARPGQGKTTLAMSILEHICRDVWGQMTSLEMSDESLYSRQIAHEIGDGNKMRDPTLLTPKDWTSIQTQMLRLKTLKILFGAQNSNLNRIIASARIAVRKYGIRVLVVDYIQLGDAEGENRNTQVGKISRALKLLAREQNIVVIGLSQLSRQVESRPNKRPRMSDLRDSGSLEQDADIITFLYREGAYNENFRSSITELITAKFRNGQTGTDYVLMKPERQQFVSATDDAIEDYHHLLAQSNPVQGGGFKSQFKKGG